MSPTDRARLRAALLSTEARASRLARIQLELAFDYLSNVAAYPQWQRYLRERQPPTLIVWGRNDPLFTVAGALAFGRGVPGAEIHLLHASHFALDEQAPAVASLLRRFLRTRALC